MAVSMNEGLGAAAVGAGDILVVQWDKNRGVTEPFRRFADWYPAIVAGAGLLLGMQRAGGVALREFADAAAISGVAMSVSRIGGIFIEQAAGTPARAIGTRSISGVSRPMMGIPRQGSGVMPAINKDPTAILRA